MHEYSKFSSFVELYTIVVTKTEGIDIYISGLTRYFVIKMNDPKEIKVFTIFI